jgi:hypothetical protein
MIKLVVGCDTVDDLLEWRKGQPEPWVLRTRQTPKRADELIDGGSIYRVFKGQILCRQPILAVDTVGEGQAARCEITLDPAIVLTAPAPRRPFQGWRYLKPEDAPADLLGDAGVDVPTDLARQLRELGAW